ncbi:hypothetical protein B0H14DRAFT_3440470 [Mycena olivaceomarginata]|nr:hypothetical protein B0H14DRAFT_3440470 [Mycena olivaceomarginata]
MRLSTVLFSLATLFVAVGATPGYSVNKRGELVSRQDIPLAAAALTSAPVPVLVAAPEVSAFTSLPG